jgi:hypothetical protein
LPKTSDQLYLQQQKYLTVYETAAALAPPDALNHPWVLKQIFTSISITGTSMRTPTTVAKAAPEESPKSMVEVAIATSKWLDAPIMAAGAASS